VSKAAVAKALFTLLRNGEIVSEGESTIDIGRVRAALERNGITTLLHSHGIYPGVSITFEVKQRGDVISLKAKRGTIDGSPIRGERLRAFCAVAGIPS
jgi:hypothetical protein